MAEIEVNKTLSEEGELIRDKGSNSISSLKKVLEDRFDDVSGVLKSINKSLVSQVSAMGKLTNINEKIASTNDQISKRDEDEAEDKLREDTFKSMNEKEDEFTASDVARGTFLADLATSLKNVLLGALGGFGSSLVGNLIKGAIVAAGVAFVGAPFIQGFVKSAFGIDIKEEFLLLKDRMLEMVGGVENILPIAKKAFIAMAALASVGWISKLVGAVTALGLALGQFKTLLNRLVPPMGNTPDLVDEDGKKKSKNKPGKKGGRLRNSLKKMGSAAKTAGKSVAISQGLRALANPYSLAALAVGGTVVMGVRYDNYLDELKEKTEGDPVKAEKLYDHFKKKYPVVMFNKTKDEFVGEVTDLGRRLYQMSDEGFEDHKRESAEKFKDNGAIKKGIRVGPSGAIIREKISPAVPHKTKILETMPSDNTSAPAIINSFNNTNAPQNNSTHNIMSGGSNGPSSSPVVYNFTTNHMIGQGTMN